jgi:hypothetical protein
MKSGMKSGMKGGREKNGQWVWREASLKRGGGETPLSREERLCADAAAVLLLQSSQKTPS